MCSERRRRAVKWLGKEVRSLVTFLLLWVKPTKTFQGNTAVPFFCVVLHNSTPVLFYLVGSRVDTSALPIATRAVYHVRVGKTVGVFVSILDTRYYGTRTTRLAVVCARPFNTVCLLLLVIAALDYYLVYSKPSDLLVLLSLLFS